MPMMLTSKSQEEMVRREKLMRVVPIVVTAVVCLAVMVFALIGFLPARESALPASDGPKQSITNVNGSGGQSTVDQGGEHGVQADQEDVQYTNTTDRAFAAQTFRKIFVDAGLPDAEGMDDDEIFGLVSQANNEVTAYFTEMFDLPEGLEAQAGQIVHEIQKMKYFTDETKLGWRDVAKNKDDWSEVFAYNDELVRSMEEGQIFGDTNIRNFSIEKQHAQVRYATYEQWIYNGLEKYPGYDNILKKWFLDGRPSFDKADYILLQMFYDRPDYEYLHFAVARATILNDGKVYVADLTIGNEKNWKPLDFYEQNFDD